MAKFVVTVKTRTGQFQETIVSDAYRVNDNESLMFFNANDYGMPIATYSSRSWVSIYKDDK
jgi:hypothetical protein